MGNELLKEDIEELIEELEVEITDIVRLFQKYFEEAKLQVSQMNESLKEKNWTGLGGVIHNIKGMAANLNIREVYHKAALFDHRLKNDCLENPEQHVQDLVKQLEKTEEEIKQYFSEKGFYS